MVRNRRSNHDLQAAGVFVMVRRQLLGIRDRVEGTGRGTGTEAELPAAIGS